MRELAFILQTQALLDYLIPRDDIPYKWHPKAGQELFMDCFSARGYYHYYDSWKAHKLVCTIK